ncbi:hypothetical protein Mgra_00006244 [Meloidogyne graminicola]|uniref:Uncharacterized protein n=1 Tax=Meloidogyne graminicola TaxID=189291 RepID=A0A8S9ZLZ8_9BILA|nr:hypothetical protein Mgra_00006244 [Meloidogyne graminicola]
MLNLTEPPPGILFPNAKPCDFDKSLTDCTKFLLNYGFYKFGLEISLASLGFAAWLRMDLLGALLVVWLFVLISISRNARKRLWPFLVFYLAFMLPLQYLLAIGLPSNMCIGLYFFNIFFTIFAK